MRYIDKNSTALSVGVHKHQNADKSHPLHEFQIICLTIFFAVLIRVLTIVNNNCYRNQETVYMRLILPKF
ncbi:hypothetical protein HMPREF9444_01781 [Succinatimonas hippei YIT 12066]|uniref:Uncharacterized protein n=1 Tax=Succinatimonas hippei (strain DSM 22608 / JCM 16073 / KCTC 15190 / YIT 12066) TaxID=762983 RepID=E8LM08_SUCHY|nr:hypothetical protein HMPREF9444_01781 [Succinatimonas hippei YIT 12066]